MKGKKEEKIEVWLITMVRSKAFTESKKHEENTKN